MASASGWSRKRTDTQAEKARDTKYNSRVGHRNIRAALKPMVDAGHANCWRCGRRIAPGEPWQLGHDDAGLTVMGPEHQGCNQRAAASKGARIANANRKARREGAGSDRPIWFRRDW